MRINSLHLKLLVLCLSASIFSCKSQFTKWEHNKTLSKIEFEKVRCKLQKHDTILIVGYLKQATTIESYPCAAGLVELTKDFKLQLFRLSDNLKVEKTIIPKDTWISLKKNGRYICFLPKDTCIQNHNCIADNDPEGISVSFDMEGNLRSFFSPADVKIDKVFCSGGKSNEIGLLKNGALEYCTISIDININDVKYEAGSILSFDYNGNVSSVKEK